MLSMFQAILHSQKMLLGIRRLLLGPQTSAVTVLFQIHRWVCKAVKLTGWELIHLACKMGRKPKWLFSKMLAYCG